MSIKKTWVKEIKQNMGFLKEQSPSYVSHYSSIHLTALRYTLLLEGLLSEGDITFAEYRNKINTTVEVMLEKALQMDENYIKNELIAESIGALN